jgi:hypothetical protein
MSDHIPHTSATLRVTIMGKLRSSALRGELISEAEFPRMLENLREFKSTIASDKVYGMLGMLDPAIEIEVDYSRSSEHLFTYLAIRYLQLGSVEMLYHCGEPHQPTSLHLPSWVPDWTRSRWTSPFFVRKLACSAAGDTESQLVIDAAASTIRVRGRLLDTVRVVDDKAEIPLTKFEPSDPVAYAPSTDPEATTREKLRRDQRKMRDAGENMVRLAWPTRDEFSWEKYENMWRTFICNRLVDDSVPDHDYGMAWEAWTDWIFQHTATEDEEDEDPYYQSIVPMDPDRMFVRDLYRQTIAYIDLPAFAGSHTRWCYNRRFFISESERYGWAVDGTRPGDRVAVIYGCQYPFLLRDAGDGTYTIIGDCYIHGLMDGEALGDEFKETELIIS